MPPDGPRWHFTRYVARVEVRVSLCRRCDAERDQGCAICRRSALASVPLCADCLIDHETKLRFRGPA